LNKAGESMDFRKATKQQLLMVLAEDCPLNYKNQAMFELQSRKEKEKSQKVARYKNRAAYSDKSYSFYS
jgi:hypothetical protein